MQFFIYNEQNIMGKWSEVSHNLLNALYIFNLRSNY